MNDHQKKFRPVSTLTGYVKDRTQTYETFFEYEKKKAIEKYQNGVWSRQDVENFVNGLPQVWENMHKPTQQTLPPIKCKKCGDMGTWIHPEYGWQQCPNPHCEAMLESNSIRFSYWKKRLECIEVAKYYTDFTLDTWMGTLTDEQKAGKWLAYAAARLYTESSDLYVQLHHVFQYLEVDPAGYPNHRKNGLLFYGDVGTGKTGLMAGIAANLEARRIPCLMVRTWWMLREIKERNNKPEPSQTATDMLKMFQQIPVLILDEFGVEQPSPADLQLMQELIRNRHGSKLPTLVTTNLNQQELTAQWHKQTTSVLEEMCHYIKVGGDKLRTGVIPLEE